MELGWRELSETMLSGSRTNSFLSSVRCPLQRKIPISGSQSTPSTNQCSRLQVVKVPSIRNGTTPTQSNALSGITPRTSNLLTYLSPTPGTVNGCGWFATSPSSISRPQHLGDIHPFPPALTAQNILTASAGISSRPKERPSMVHPMARRLRR